MKGAHQDPGEEAAANENQAKLPRRDWILLPLICLLTVGTLAVGTELSARRLFYRPPSTNGKCMQFVDPSAGLGAIPNAVCRTQSEGRWMEYRFNSCGFRTNIDCKAPKSPGAYRIVMSGSSTAMGLGVPQEKSFAALLPVELSQLTGRKVELYNEAMTPAHPENIARWFNEVLDAKPDLILWVVTPFDVQIGGSPPALEPDPRAGALAKALFQIRNRPATESLPDALRDVWTNYSRTAVLLRHVIYASQSQFLKNYLMGDDVSGFLKVEPSAEWSRRLGLFDGYAASIGAQAKAAGVPLVVVLLPVRAQVAMVSTGESPDGYDPYALDRELRAIVTSHGGTYIDVLSDFRTIISPERIYQQGDEHSSDEGHAFISSVLARQLTSGAVPALALPTPPQIAQEQHK